MINLRKEYLKSHLDESGAHKNPFSQFQTWFAEVIQSDILFPDSMTLATVTPNGMPNARIVLLKAIDENGLSFFTNHNSPKGHELDNTPHACCVFWWKEFERQVRISGSVERLSSQASDAYFNTRPRGARLSAWASSQSEVISNRGVLEQKMLQIEAQFKNQDVPRPENWGGYLLVPHTFEFWQGRENRLHDRLRYRKVGNDWILERLAP